MGRPRRAGEAFTLVPRQGRRPLGLLMPLICRLLVLWLLARVDGAAVCPRLSAWPHDGNRGGMAPGTGCNPVPPIRNLRHGPSPPGLDSSAAGAVGLVRVSGYSPAAGRPAATPTHQLVYVYTPLHGNGPWSKSACLCFTSMIKYAIWQYDL